MATSKELASFAKTRAETGFRSQSEVKVNGLVSKLAGDGGRVFYEKAALPFSYTVNRRYTPDFVLPEKAMVLEIKGRFLDSDRAKMLLVKRQYPNLDIRIVLDRPNTLLSKKSTTSYATWAEKSGFPWCATKDFPPPEWCEHRPTKEQQEAFATAIHIK